MKRKSLIFFLFLFSIIITSGTINFAEDNKTHDYDLLIKNGVVFEGSLKPAFKADVAVKDGKIVKIDKSIKGSAERVIDAKGLSVTPGFIDLHTHVEVGMDSPENRAGMNYLTQGTTTVIVGACGYSPWIIYEKPEKHMERLTEEGVGLNMAFLFGQGGIRRIVVGDEDREATPKEIEKMKAILKDAMEQGAYGISTGRAYPPGSFAETDEVIELAKIVASYGGVYHTHMKNESSELLEAVKEVLEIAEKSGVQVHISHFKAAGKMNWGLAKKACELIEEARTKGIKITADQYPYRFGGNGPTESLIPPKAWIGDAEKDVFTQKDMLKIYDHLPDSELIDIYTKITPYAPLSKSHRSFIEGLPRKRLVSLVAQSSFFPYYLRMGVLDMFSFQPVNVRDPKQRQLFLKRLKDPEEKKKIHEEMKKHLEIAGAENISIEICVENDLEGKSLKEVADIKGKTVEDTAIELGLMGTRVVSFLMGEDDIEYIMSRDYVGTGSDGDAAFYGLDGPFGTVHIRSYTTFLHKIKKYVLQRKAISLEHAIRSQTSLPAEIMGFDDRGWIKEGYKADINVIDLKNLRIKATVANPHQYCEGINYLIINGKLVIDDGQWNGTLAGQVLKMKKN